jgi:hypothetical protein
MVREVAEKIVESLRTSPALLGSIVTNVVLLAGFAYILTQIAESSERKDNLINELSRQCGARR